MDESAFGPGVHVGDGIEPPVWQVVRFDVVLLGFTPGVEADALAACFACPGDVACDDDELEVEAAFEPFSVFSAFFSWPGAEAFSPL